MIIPYKVKNPIKRFPTATLILIIGNVLVFGFTTHGFLVIKKEAVLAYGFLWGHTSFANLISYTFLHVNIFHLLGNMLFFWVFSGAVEDRLGIPSFLFVYFTAGIIGGIAQDIFGRAFIGRAIPIIGASACVMGVMGAYWYMFPWSRVCVFYWFFLFFRGTFEIAAVWVIGTYFFFDLLFGVFYGVAKVHSGVGYIAHIFGMLAGIAFCKIVNARRDTGVVSEAKASIPKSDFSLLSLWDLAAVVGAEPDNPETLRALMDKAAKENSKDVIDNAMSAAGPAMIEKAPRLVARYLIDFQGDIRIYQPGQILKLAALIRKEGMHREAMTLYQGLVQNFPDRPEVEMATWKMAQIQWNELKDGTAALSSLAEMQSRFPNGNLFSYCQSLQSEIQRSSLT